MMLVVNRLASLRPERLALLLVVAACGPGSAGIQEESVDTSGTNSTNGTTDTSSTTGTDTTETGPGTDTTAAETTSGTDTGEECAAIELPMVEWEKLADGAADDDHDVAFAATVDDAGRLYVAGFRSDLVADGGQNLWIACHEPDGALAWEMTFDGNGDDGGARSIAHDASTGTILVAGTHGNATAWLVRVDDLDGAEIWQRTYPGVDGFSTAGATTVTATGDLLVGGWEMIDAAGPSVAAWIRRVTVDGDEVWKQSVGGPTGWSTIRGLAPAPDGSFVVAGSWMVSEASRELYVARWQDDGTEVWSDVRDGGSELFDEAHGVVVAEDGMIFVAGMANGDNLAQGDAWIGAYDPGGELVWSETIDGTAPAIPSDEAKAVMLDCVGNPVFGGTFDSTDAEGQGNFWFRSHAPDGELRWELILDGVPSADEDHVFGLAPHPSLGFYAVGSRAFPGSDAVDAWVAAFSG
jgi:hypothetical protein